MKIALAQINTGTDVEANLAKVKEYTARAAGQGAQAVVFPEATMASFGSDLAAVATQFGEYWAQQLRDLATEYGITVIAGEFEQVGGKVRNHLAAYQPGGEVDLYAKIHLYDAFGYKESDAVESGDELVTIDLAGTRAGLAICYDIRFPKLFAELSRAGAAVAIVSASWGAGPGKVEQWKALARARALDSNMYVVALGQADPEVSGVEVPAGAPTGVGFSLVADPFGNVLQQLEGEEALAVVEIDPETSAEARKAIPVLENAKLGY